MTSPALGSQVTRAGPDEARLPGAPGDVTVYEPPNPRVPATSWLETMSVRVTGAVPVATPAAAWVGWPPGSRPSRSRGPQTRPAVTAAIPRAAAATSALGIAVLLDREFSGGEVLSAVLPQG